MVAGDVFDVTNPSNQARELYYEFLGQLAKTRCWGAVIIGGNHDSPTMLDAPRDVLRSLNLHVVGAARAQVQNQVLEVAGWGDPEPRLLVAAVPYLRERDLRNTKPGETAEERLAGLRAGIRDHYAAVAEAATAARRNPDIPILATGHLFAGGATDHPEKKSHIYQADEHNIDEEQFPDCFDYVALGHVHRAQSVGESGRIRYAGSLIPLTFVEGQQPRSVRLVELGKAGEPVVSRSIRVPYFRPLHRMHQSLAEVRQAIRNAVAVADGATAGAGLVPWAEVRVKTEESIPNLRQTLLDTISEASGDDRRSPGLEVLRISQERPRSAPAAAPLEQKQLDELDPAEVFAGVLATEGYGPERTTELLADFRDLYGWMKDEEL